MILLLPFLEAIIFIFFEDEEKVLIVSSKGFEIRGIEEPEAEKYYVIKEGFTECRPLICH